MIKKIVLTEEDGNKVTVGDDELVSSVVATLEDDTEVTLFPTATVPGDVPTITVPLDTPVKIVAA